MHLGGIISYHGAGVTKNWKGIACEIMTFLLAATGHMEKYAPMSMIL